MFKYKKDPVLQEGDLIGRYKGDQLISASIVKLEKDKIWCKPMQGDFLTYDDPFLWSGRYIRLVQLYLGISELWSMRPRTETPLLNLTSFNSTNINYVETDETFSYSIPYATQA